MTRRIVVVALSLVASSLCLPRLQAIRPSAPVLQSPAPPAAPGDPFPQWSVGQLDIHQIATGRGNAAFVAFPDGTTMLLDAGDAGDTEDASPVPNASRSPGEWITRYIRHMLVGRRAELDYAVFTHFHKDHIGGVAVVAADLPMAHVIDRGWPDYGYLTPPNDEFYARYRQVVASHASVMARAQAGSTRQIVPVHAPVDGFDVRIISVNDRVWTGSGDETKVRFPAIQAIAAPEDRPTENMCSISMRIRYGRFDYFTGGDMPGYPVPGAPAWHDVESDVARAIGPTDAHMVNHHGSIEEENLFWLATLRSRVMVVPAWAATHPSPDVLKRMLSTRVYPQPRDIFITSFRPETKAAIGGRAKQVASDHGHVVIRVEPGGSRYWVMVLDDTAETYRVRSVHGPYKSE